MTILARREGGWVISRCFGMRKGGRYVSLETSLPYGDLQNPTFVEADDNDDV